MIENKGDLISREALIKWIDDSVSQYGYAYSTDMLNMWGLFKDYLINNAPTVEQGVYMTGEDCDLYMKGYNQARKDFRPQGQWIFRNGVTCGGYYKCSNCGEVERAEKNFCPNCGADMKGGAEE